MWRLSNRFLIIPSFILNRLHIEESYYYTCLILRWRRILNFTYDRRLTFVSNNRTSLYRSQLQDVYSLRSTIISTECLDICCIIFHTKRKALQNTYCIPPDTLNLTFKILQNDPQVPSSKQSSTTLDPEPHRLRFSVYLVLRVTCSYTRVSSFSPSSPFVYPGHLDPVASFVLSTLTCFSSLLALEINSLNSLLELR